MNLDELLKSATQRSLNYLHGIADRRVFPDRDSLGRLSRLGGNLPEEGEKAEDVLALLDEIGSPATVATTGGRYFGFVNGATLHASLAANWLAGAWDQNVGLWIETPVGAYIEEVCLSWLREVLNLPSGTGVGFVTGATMANFTGLLAARHAVLEQAGWDVESHGLFGAPPVTVIVGDEVHASLLRALSLLGLGRDRVIRVPADSQGRMIPDAMPRITPPAIVCIQVGNVNTGACDPASALCDIA